MSIIWFCRYSLNFTTHPSFDAHFIPAAISFEGLFSDSLDFGLFVLDSPFLSLYYYLQLIQASRKTYDGRMQLLPGKLRGMQT
jgi:hypothetical protein